MNELISIIVPVYNVEDYLRFTLDSITSQTYTNWELILVDDGSTDNSPIICEEYASKDIRIKVFHTPNRGVSHARNFGIDHSKGNYIIFCDSDDLMEKNTLFLLYDNQKKANADIVSCSYELIGEKAEVYETKALHELSQIMPNSEINALTPEYWGVIWGKLIKRDLIIHNHIRFEEEIYLSEDTLFCELCTIYAHSIISVSLPLIGYRQRNSSITKSGKSFFFQAVKRYQYLEHHKVNIQTNKKLYDSRKDMAFIDMLMWLYTPKKKLETIIDEVQYLYSQKNMLGKLRSLTLTQYTKKQQIFFFILSHFGKCFAPFFIYIQQRIDSI